MSRYVIKASGLSRNFGDLKAIQGLDLEVGKGSIYGFLGPNGCGKTTAIRMLTGLLKPTAGEVEVLGRKLPRDAEKLRQLKRELLQLPEVISAAQLGARLRVLVKDSIVQPLGFLEQQESIGSQDNLTLVRPSLEDVFVTCTGAGGQ